MPNRWKNSTGILAIALALAGCNESVAGEDPSQKPRLGLFTSLPIVWGEGGFDNIIDGTNQPDWVRTELERDFNLEPLDALESDQIEPYDRLFLAQPRPLAPSENVALDEWVAQGGELVLLADPMLTRHSDYAVGDRRRPEDIVLLSPILTRWGLELRFDEEQPGGRQAVEAFETDFPVNLRGTFSKTGSDVARCTIESSGLVARCDRGEGTILLVADAALLDASEDGTASAEQKALLRRLFDSN